jgi:hypothetical protein
MVSKACFARCASLSDVTFEPNSKLTRLEDYAFDRCASLKAIALPPSVSFMSTSCFHDCEHLLSIGIGHGSPLLNCSIPLKTSLPQDRLDSTSDSFGLECDHSEALA